MKKIWAWHSWLGLYSGLVIIILSITGSLAIFKNEIDQTLNPALYQVKPTAVDQLPQAQIQAIVQRFENVTNYAVNISRDPKRSWLLSLYQKNKHTGQKDCTEIFIDPYSGKVLGQRDRYKTFSYTLRTLHIRLFNQWYGRQLVGLAGICLLISTILGVIIYSPFMKKQKFGQFKRKKKRYNDWHKYLGIIALFFNFMMAVTGAYLGFQPWIKQHIYRPPSPQKSIIATAKVSLQDERKIPINYADVSAKAFGIFTSADELRIQYAKAGNGNLEVAVNMEGACYDPFCNWLLLDKADLKVLDKFDIKTATAAAKWYYLPEGLHFGQFGGVLLKVIYSIFGLITGFLSISGYIIYLKRAKKKRLKKGKKIVWGTFIGLLMILTLLFFISQKIAVSRLLLWSSPMGWAALIIMILLVYRQNSRK